MNLKEITETFVVISNLINLWSLWFIQKYFSVVRINTRYLLYGRQGWFPHIYVHVCEPVSRIYNLNSNKATTGKIVEYVL